MFFPEDFWDVIRPVIGDYPDDQIAALADEVTQYFGGPRDIQLVRDFLTRGLPPGRIYVYGAGTHSEAIYNTLSSARDVVVLGFLDQNAERLGRFHGHEVITPEMVLERDFDYILISYEHMETKLADRLQRLGVPPSKIAAIYSNPDYIRFATDAYFNDIQRRLSAAPFEYVIVRSRVHEVIADEALARIFPPEKTLVIHIGPKHRANLDERWFWSINVQQCMALVAKLLTAINPKTIFLSTEQEYDLAYFVIRHALPNTRLIHEIYDFFPIIPDDWIARGIDASPRVIELMRLSNYYSSRLSQLIVSKRAGADWEQVAAGFKTPYLYVFPGVGFTADDAVIEVNPVDLLPPPDCTRLLYAGALVPSDFDVYKRSDYNFLPLLEEIVKTPGFSVDIYNSSHANTSQNPIFADYLEKYSRGSIHYHLRVPYNSLLSLMSNYHYGWLCLPPREKDLPDQLAVICNRFSAYIYGGLPIIVDAEWRCIADLVKEFDAGVVVADAAPEKVLAAISGADNQRKRDGARKLSAYMQRHNQAVIADIRRQAL